MSALRKKVKKILADAGIRTCEKSFPIQRSTAALTRLTKEASEIVSYMSHVKESRFVRKFIDSFGHFMVNSS